MVMRITAVGILTEKCNEREEQLLEIVHCDFVQALRSSGCKFDKANTL